MNFVYTDAHNGDFVLLCHELDDFLNKLVGGEENRLQFISLNSLQDIHDVMLMTFLSDVLLLSGLKMT